MRSNWLMACALGVLVSGTSCGSAEDEPATTERQSVAAEERFEQAKTRMVEHHLQGRAGRDIRDKRVLEAMGKVPRHAFVPENLRTEAYRDSALPIGHGQTISQPYVVAFMTEKLEPKASDRVLEVGTGSGYQAAILAELVAEVYSIEIVEPLGQRAKRTLETLGYENVHVRIGDGYQGWPEQAPFDAVIVTCAPENIPQPLVDQLREGGRMIIPVGPTRGTQHLYLLRKRAGKVEQESVLPVRFVPMTGEAEKTSGD